MTLDKRRLSAEHRSEQEFGGGHLYSADRAEGPRRGAPAMMDIAFERRAMEIFDDALLLPADEQDAWVTEACGGDNAVLDAVLALRKAARRAAILPTELPAAYHNPAVAPPEHIGVYRLVHLLGRGGMGDVWRGERDDGLFDQTVAIKLVRAGLFTSTAASFFDTERRVLARLRHRNIAQLFDGGVTKEGLSYFVMELIEGQSIDEAAAKADSKEIARLLIEVCAGVQHAHANFVVHADIKPSNILVAKDGAPKLLDFGIAKVMNAAQDGDAESAAPMTPAYASPQRLSGEPPAPSDDIFALGVVLSELLTGAHRGPEEQLPLKPSAVCSPLQRAELAGDLDAIVARATDPRPEHRYASASELADDLTRWLQRRPVRARGGDWRYSTAKLLVRHRSAFIAGAAALAGLIIALAVTTQLYQRAERERINAEARFNDTRALAKYQLFDLYDALARTPGVTETRYRLAQEAQIYLDRLSRTEGAPEAVRLETGAGYIRLAEIMGVPGRPNLADAPAARRNIARAREILTPLKGDQRDIELARAALHEAALAIWTDQKAEAAIPFLDEADKLLAGVPQSDQVRWTGFTAALRRLELLDWKSDFQAEKALATKVLAQIEAWPASMRGDTGYAIAHSTALTKLADATWYLGDHVGATDHYRAADAELDAAAKRFPNQADVMTGQIKAKYNIATAFEGPDAARRAIPILQDTLAIGEKLLPMNSRDETVQRSVRLARAALAESLADAGRLKESLALMEEQLDGMRALSAARPGDMQTLRDLAWNGATTALVRWRTGDRQGACRGWAEADRLYRDVQANHALNDWDRANQLPPLAQNLKVCRGEAPASTIDQPK